MTGAVVWTVSITGVALPPGVTLLGEKEHEVLRGRFEQLNEIALVNPPVSGFTVSEYMAGCPAETVWDPLLEEIPKSITRTLTV